MSFIFDRKQIITNFSDDYPLYKRILANIIYFGTGLIIKPRTNSLTDKDIKKACNNLKKGDIVIFGNLKILLPVLMGDPVNHTSMYIGKREFIHSAGNGVIITPFHEIMSEYSSFVILRPKDIKGKKKIIKKAVRYTKKQLNKPYDYYFTDKKEYIFCSKLINDAYKENGYDTKLKNFRQPDNNKERIQQKIHKCATALRPSEFIKGNFDIVLASENIIIDYKNKKLIEKKPEPIISSYKKKSYDLFQKGLTFLNQLL